jgi:hypothetical protein
MEKLRATEIDGKWFMTGRGLKIPVKDQNYAEVLIRTFESIEITDPNFKPGRRKK